MDVGADGHKRLTFRGFEALTVEALRELRDEKDGQLASVQENFQRVLEEQKQLIERLLAKIESLRAVAQKVQ